MYKRQAIVGVKVISGTLKPKVSLMNEKGMRLGRVLSIQKEGESLSKAEAGEEVAISLEGVTVGRQINEGDVLYTDVPKKQLQELLEKNIEESLSREILNIKEGIG